MTLYRAIIVTALREEYTAVRAHIENPKEETYKGTVYEIGRFSADGRSWDIIILEAGRYGENAAIEAERAINHFNPTVALFVGVAGGLINVAIGDVVAATKVYGYEAGKAEDRFHPIGEVYRSSHAMVHRARACSRGTDWLKRIKGSLAGSAPKIFVEPIAAGSKVLKSTQSEIYGFLRTNYSDAIAVEMEGLGFLAASYANPEVQVLVIRGISDLIDKKEEADASGSKEVASQNASALAFEILATLDLGEGHPISPDKIENIPHVRNRYFAGREILLTKLSECKDIDKSRGLVQTKVLAGLGGAGKTQIALEYCYRHIDDNAIIWWIRSNSLISIKSDYAELASRLDLPESEDQVIQAESVKQWLGNNANWLLIFDNAENPEILERYLPKRGSGQVIITSRNPSWSGSACVLNVLEFDRFESIEFLIRRTGHEDRIMADTLAQELGDLPLALEQAGAYVKETGISLTEYMELFRQMRKEILKLGKPTAYSETIATTWLISIEAAKKESPLSADLLNLCSFLAPDRIPRSLLTKYVGSLAGPSASAVRIKLELNAAVAALWRYSLLRHEIEGFSIHRLVQAITRDRLSEDEAKGWRKIAVMLICDAYPSNGNDPRNWPLCSELLPHAFIVANDAMRFEEYATEIGRLFFHVGLFLGARHELTEAILVLEKAVELLKKSYGSESIQVAQAQGNLGIVLRMQGKIEYAKFALLSSLEIYEIAYGPESLQVARTLANLANVFRDLGKLHESRNNLERSLKIKEKAYGAKSKEVAILLINLGNVLRRQGQLESAKSVLYRSLEILEKTCEPDDLHTAASLNNIGLVLQEQGNFDDSKNMFKQAFKMNKKIYGTQHPETASCLHNLGNVLRDQNKLGKAESIIRRALIIKKKAYGPKHIEVAYLFNDLGLVLQKQGNLEAARFNLERALEIKEKTYGLQHPEVAKTLINIGNVQRDLGQLEASKRTYDRAVKIYIETLGEDHPEVKWALSCSNSLNNL
jgi:tetratricopeptide (TPR) repeat protein/nucleoside phosphorylase